MSKYLAIRIVAATLILTSACVQPAQQLPPAQPESRPTSPPDIAERRSIAGNAVEAQPIWPHYTRARVSLCNMPMTSDYVVKAKPLQIKSPIQLELSPWPGELVWVTPVDWQVIQTVLTNPLPGRVLGPLTSSVSTFVVGPFTDASSTRIFGITSLDGMLGTDAFGSFYSTPAGWSWDSGDEKFATESDLIQAINSESKRLPCRRMDVLGPTKLANEARRLAAAATPIVTPNSLNDAGFPAAP